MGTDMARRKGDAELRVGADAAIVALFRALVALIDVPPRDAAQEALTLYLKQHQSTAIALLEPLQIAGQITPEQAESLRKLLDS